MGFMEKVQKIKETPRYKSIRGTAMLKLFGLTKVPLIFLVNPRVKVLNEKSCEILIPLNKVTKNHLNSMYFGTLAIGADCAIGLFAMYKADQIPNKKFSVVFKNFKAEFLKRPESDVIFSCKEADALDAMLKEAISTNGRVTRSIRAEARLPKNQDELVAEFELGLSLKPIN